MIAKSAHPSDEQLHFIHKTQTNKNKTKEMLPHFGQQIVENNEFSLKLILCFFKCYYI